MTRAIDSSKVLVTLDGVPETMLWTLHNRASEALLVNPIIKDEEAVRIYRSIDYDFLGKFGVPDGSHALRSKIFDDAVCAWMEEHHDGTVVELGCGLETQFSRVDNGRVRWMCIDVPEAIDVRERFLSPNERCSHIRCSALELNWLDSVDVTKPVFVSVQGLLMYFDKEEVWFLISQLFRRIELLDCMFDVVPRWFSNKTMKGLNKTKNYIAPKMPWGINTNEISEFVTSCGERVESVHTQFYGPTRGVSGRALTICARLPFLRNRVPNIVHTISKG